ncbi:PucR family transcriptional regulator [Pseudonocardia sulfidoxydans NBRC 16205]|uniref:PucR family transcriptional regulator n=1 Tax=Pseudonocardia sulfidoxydans NBRC 16205 TaxID=1223511 RepID=A0A511DL99_9PSEU|nr:PucR family transcriptional regulator [Pseudonocardia sulfidoxydans NBRC 16205]
MPTGAPVSSATLRRLELGAGGIAGACLAAMDRRQPWFRKLPAALRSGVQLVTQTGVANFVGWLVATGGGPTRASEQPEPTDHTAADVAVAVGGGGGGDVIGGHPGAGSVRLTAEAFRIAPRDLARRLTLRQTVELVRVATDVLEERLPPLAADDAEFRVLSEAVLRFGREVAFAAATAYAGAAEDRGAWDARLEALVVDGVVRGDTGDELVSRASALGWDPAGPVRVVVGTPPSDHAPERLGELRRRAGRAGRSLLVGAQGSRLIVLLSDADHDADDLTEVLAAVALDFGPGPVVVGPLAADLPSAPASARDALSGLRAAPAWPEAPRPVPADDLLPERAFSGDPEAHRRLVETVVTPLAEAGGELWRTLAAYLDGGGSLEACARALFVHPNTVRYRLRRVSDLTGRSPADPRDAQVLRAALLAGRLAGAEAGADPS